jgi:hypothetical protein
MYLTMTQEHPITPPLELIREWALNHDYTYANELWDYIATQAARWGADQELEACCKWMKTIAMTKPWDTVAQLALELRDARRPKPPSLKEQALEALKKIEDNEATYLDSSIIRRALETLPDEQ